MNYHNITHDDMLNGSGLRVVLWVSGCNHICEGCQNPQTWDYESGIPFDIEAKKELFNELNKDYISGITFSGGDPLHENNIETILNLVNEIRLSFPDKSIWLYSGYTIEEAIKKYGLKYSDIQLKRFKIIKQCDVFVDGRYIESKRDVTLHWTGSSNQRVIDIKKSLEQKEIVLYSEG